MGGAAMFEHVKLRHFHVLKHCCATHLLSKGFGVERVQDWIGHANIQSTMEYAKVTNARRDDMAQELKEMWRCRAVRKLPTRSLPTTRRENVRCTEHSPERRFFCPLSSCR